MSQRIFVFAVSSAVSKSGKAYQYQAVQIIQGPKHPDAHDRIFVNSDAQPLEPGAYEADMYVRSTPQGNRVAFENFRKVE